MYERNETILSCVMCQMWSHTIKASTVLAYQHEQSGGFAPLCCVELSKRAQKNIYPRMPLLRARLGDCDVVFPSLLGFKFFSNHHSNSGKLKLLWSSSVPESKANKTYKKQQSQNRTRRYVSHFDEVIVAKDVTLLTVYVSPLEPTHEALQSARSAIH